MADDDSRPSGTGDTPYSRAKYSSTQQGSLRNELPGNLPQRRKTKAVDMTTKSIGDDLVEFANANFPQPPTPHASLKPTFLTNPFNDLANANTMSEKNLQDAFVSLFGIYSVLDPD